MFDQLCSGHSYGNVFWIVKRIIRHYVQSALERKVEEKRWQKYAFGVVQSMKLY